MRTLINIIKDNLAYRQQIMQLAKANQKKKYKGSDLGLVWAFIRPAMYISVFYVAISLGFKSTKNIEGLVCSYFIWLTVGFVAWFYMQSMFLGGAGCFKKYRGLMKNVKFPTTVIPTIVATSNMLIHLVLVCVMFVFVTLMGCTPSIYWIQLPFYIVWMFIFGVFWSFAVGTITVLSKDFFNLLQVLSQALFWLSGIIFDISRLQDTAARWIFLFNPITYVVEGYRNCICKHIWFFEQPMQFGCYLVSLMFMMLVSLFLYSRLRKRLPDLV